MSEMCVYCYKPAIKGQETLTRWYEGLVDKVAHWECSEAANRACPQCKSETGIKLPRDLPIYCEDCGWPDENFSGSSTDES